MKSFLEGSYDLNLTHFALFQSVRLALATLKGKFLRIGVNMLHGSAKLRLWQANLSLCHPEILIK